MRSLLKFLLLCTFAYLIVGIVFWYQWHSGVSNSHLASYPDDIHTFWYVLSRWPALVS